MRLAVVRLLVAAAQRRHLLQLALEGAEGEVDQRRQLRRHVADFLLLLHGEIVLRRHVHLHHDAVAVALVVRGDLLRQRDAAAGDALGVALQALQALGDVALHPFGAVDVVKDDLGRGLHVRSRSKIRAELRPGCRSTPAGRRPRCGRASPSRRS